MHKNKNYTSAIEYYKKALSLNPSKEEVYINLAQIYLEDKNYALANEICQKGLMILHLLKLLQTPALTQLTTQCSV